MLWWSPRERIERLVRLEGVEHLKGGKTIVFAPHFVGFEATLARLALDYPVAMMYRGRRIPVSKPSAGRTRFGGVMYPRQGGTKKESPSSIRARFSITCLTSISVPSAPYSSRFSACSPPR